MYRCKCEQRPFPFSRNCDFAQREKRKRSTRASNFGRGEEGGGRAEARSNVKQRRRRRDARLEGKKKKERKERKNVAGTRVGRNVKARR